MKFTTLIRCYCNAHTARHESSTVNKVHQSIICQLCKETAWALRITLIDWVIYCMWPILLSRMTDVYWMTYIVDMAGNHHLCLIMYSNLFFSLSLFSWSWFANGRVRKIVPFWLQIYIIKVNQSINRHVMFKEKLLLIFSFRLNLHTFFKILQMLKSWCWRLLFKGKLHFNYIIISSNLLYLV